MWPAAIDACGLKVAGMRVTGEHGVVIEGRYPDGVGGRALLRRHLDWMLLQDALAAGAQFEPAFTVRRALVDADRVAGAWVSGRQFEGELRARVTIAADGRRSTLAFGLGLARHPARPRRWAIGAYVENTALATPPRDLGEMHVRPGRYIGIAPVPGGLTNVCLVKPWRPGDRGLGDPRTELLGELARDPVLRDRFAGARLVGAPVVLGPLAVEVRDTGLDGLLLAGDAAGFIDPMTGDGLRFAVRGAELAAHAALEALEHGWYGVHKRLAARAPGRVCREVAVQPHAARAGDLAGGGRGGVCGRSRRAVGASRRDRLCRRRRAGLNVDGAAPDRGVRADARRGAPRGAQRTRAAQPGRHRAARRRLLPDARRLSRRVSRDDRRGFLAAAQGIDVRPAARGDPRASRCLSRPKR